MSVVQLLEKENKNFKEKKKLSCEYCTTFKNSFFHKTPLVAASEKFKNLQGKHQWRRRHRFIFFTNTTE